jgi:4-hydroxy-tetrahydrodipicolinate synthase
MLSSFTMSLMSTFLLGADGAISGMGSVAADLQAELFEACGKGDLDGARRLNDRLDPLVRVFYAPPFVDMHNRMKEALVLLGRIPAAHVRPPLTPVSAGEREAIRHALVAAGLERSGMRSLPTSWRAKARSSPARARRTSRTS